MNFVSGLPGGASAEEERKRKESISERRYTKKTKYIGWL
jgi:hypothetical protein